MSWPVSASVCKAALACVAAAALWFAARPCYADGPQEYEAKAAYLLNFSRYVNWPGADNSPMQVCVLGQDPFGEVLDRALRGRSSNGRQLQARRLQLPEQAVACQLLYIGQSEDRHLSDWLAPLQDKPVLTVGESPRFLRDGGMINLLLVRNTVRFEINLDAASRAGLKISSRMLGVAENVFGKGEGGK